MKVPDFIVDSILLDMQCYGLRPRRACDPGVCEDCDRAMREIAQDIADTVWYKLQQRIALEIQESLDLSIDNWSATLTAELKYHDTAYFGCVVCQSSVPSHQGGLCPDHTYDVPEPFYPYKGVDL